MQSYKDNVLLALRRALIGLIDTEEPPLEVVSVEEDTGGSEVLGLTVGYQVHDPAGMGSWVQRSRGFGWDEWEDYTDKSASRMGAALASEVAIELRESVNSVPKESRF